MHIDTVGHNFGKGTIGNTCFFSIVSGKLKAEDELMAGAVIRRRSCIWAGRT